MPLSMFTRSLPGSFTSRNQERRSTDLSHLLSEVLVRVPFNPILFTPALLDRELRRRLPLELLIRQEQLCSGQDTLPAQCL